MRCQKKIQELSSTQVRGEEKERTEGIRRGLLCCKNVFRLAMLLLHIWFHRQGHAQNLRNLSRLIHISVLLNQTPPDFPYLSIFL